LKIDLTSGVTQKQSLSNAKDMIKSNGSNLLHNSSGKVTQSFGTQIKKKVGGGTTPKSSQINIDNNSMVK
jgi:hypothetical protein